MKAVYLMKWRIDFFNQAVKDNAESLHQSISAKFEAILDKMLEHGPDLGLPFTKAMGKGLFEIRAKGHAGIPRGFFCTISKKHDCHTACIC
jgi:phage-related protein